jgi:hypothetical protein
MTELPGSVFRTYDVTSPSGEAFTAVIVIGDDKLWHVLSDASGDWAPEPRLAMEDLIMPEQKKGDWDIYRRDKTPANGNGGTQQAADAKKNFAATAIKRWPTHPGDS